ncbi:MAG: hypothetical protein A3F84_14940 [Candidatus Handelsmanbacteria bacterium RIFCSPLOWO2_12_FULL_64_10]|uniref:Exosortase A n=1 Tax=Handelsmanbacteria sp. (strain RIFCSPLOWO2_12_FULL_64_10) TaxID=1817868 RepID=A0A1F6C549_HANXR|nr:MAG: hypothetical protein A3F84_14940 [Candidatus Handelsmanbacteria bacterium RIFCSPLOWO2_12_FULL_64_10]
MLLPASALALLLGLLYLPVVRDLWLVWETDLTYSHGFLIPPVAAYVVWSKRGLLSGTPVRPSFWGAGPLAGGLFLLLLQA